VHFNQRDRLVATTMMTLSDPMMRTLVRILTECRTPSVQNFVMSQFIETSLNFKLNYSTVKTSIPANAVHASRLGNTGEHWGTLGNTREHQGTVLKEVSRLAIWVWLYVRQEARLVDV